MLGQFLGTGLWGSMSTFSDGNKITLILALGPKIFPSNQMLRIELLLGCLERGSYFTLLYLNLVYV